MYDDPIQRYVVVVVVVVFAKKCLWNDALKLFKFLGDRLRCQGCFPEVHGEIHRKATVLVFGEAAGRADSAPRHRVDIQRHLKARPGPIEELRVFRNAARLFRLSRARRGGRRDGARRSGDLVGSLDGSHARDGARNLFVLEGVTITRSIFINIILGVS